MRHDDLQNIGREPHREIDQRLPTTDQKDTLDRITQDQKLEIIAAGNSDFDQDGNWRFVIDSSGNMDLDKRESGSWVNKATWS
ncbi:MAG: hypothetical protein ACOC7Y_01660 [Chloroflexota bacterium]